MAAQRSRSRGTAVLSILTRRRAAALEVTQGVHVYAVFRLQERRDGWLAFNKLQEEFSPL